MVQRASKWDFVASEWTLPQKETIAVAYLPIIGDVDGLDGGGFVGFGS